MKNSIMIAEPEEAAIRYTTKSPLVLSTCVNMQYSVGLRVRCQSQTRIQFLTLPPQMCKLCQIPSLFKCQFSHIQNGDNNKQYYHLMLWGLHVIMHGKLLTLFWACECLRNLSYFSKGPHKVKLLNGTSSDRWPLSLLAYTTIGWVIK